jgi:hypothetical protein
MPMPHVDEIFRDAAQRERQTRDARLRALAGLPPMGDCGCGYRVLALAALDVIGERDAEIARLRAQLDALEAVHAGVPGR